MHPTGWGPSFDRRPRGFRFPLSTRLALAVILGLLLLACGAHAPATAPTGSTLTATHEPTALATATARPSPLAFPLTLRDDEGTLVTIPAPPERVVSLTPATTEILFAIGAGPTVVATTDADDFPPEAVDLPDVASFGSVEIEAIVDLEADLVIAGGNGYTPTDAIARMRSLAMPVIVVYAPSVDGVVRDVRLIGRGVGRTEEAEALAAAMTADFATVAEATAGLGDPRVFYEIDASTVLYGPAERSFLAEMIELAGGEPITTGSPFDFEMPLERLIEEDPEVIVLGDAAYGVTPGQVAARPGWAGMTAVRDGAIRPVADILVTRPGPRLPQGLRLLAEAIHPQLDLPYG